MIKKIAGLKIYFGHQSVGFNMIEGIQDILQSRGDNSISIIESSDPLVLDRPVLAHSAVGRNRDPILKIREYASWIEQGIGEKADIVFMKPCYVDIDRNSDIYAVFSAYQETMARLKKRYPRTTFVHVTMPLVGRQAGLMITAKNTVKKIIGRFVVDLSSNIERMRFNDLIRLEYVGKEPLFDLERIESTLPGGKRLELIKDGARYPALLPLYTDDGGHLNAIGRRVVASELMAFLYREADMKKADMFSQ